jgi:hypothetical protein
VKPSIEEEEMPMAEKPLADQLVTVVLTSGGDWREPFIRYPMTADVPHEKIEMEHLVQHSKHYVLVEADMDVSHDSRVFFA